MLPLLVFYLIVFATGKYDQFCWYENAFAASLFWKNTFPGRRHLSWHIFSLGTLNISLYCLLAYIICVEQLLSV